MIRTGYSFRCAYGHLEDVASRLSELGWSKQPISDRNSTFGFLRWTKLVPHPVYGVELAVGPEQSEERRRPQDYWTFLAIDELKPLHELIGIATGNGNWLPYKAALNTRGVIKIAGPWVLLDQMKLKPDVYVGLSPATPLGLYKLAKKRKFKFVAMMNNCYPRADDKEIYRIAIGWRAGNQIYPQHIMSDEEWLEACAKFPKADCIAALQLRNKLLLRCKATMKKATLFKPKKPKTLQRMCEEGAQRKLIDLSNQTYADRLNRELDMIKHKKFEDYFYIIADLVSWAKQRMIVGPARGSSCGSLVCYLLDITAVDPLKFDLIFERFIDINRSDLPDIDIDFSDAHRDEVFDYAIEKYGRERVARLGTTGMFMPKSILNLFGISLKIPKWEVSKVTDSLIHRHSGDSRAKQQYEDTLTDTDAGRSLHSQYPAMMLGKRLEGHPNNASQHAAGLCITQEPINNYVAVDHRSFSVMCDKKDAEELNMLKIDMLGLTQLSIFERTLELIGEKPINGWLEQLPLDDQKAFDVLNRRHFSGIFQFNGAALKSLANQINFTHINDIILLTALARPGPMASGGANSWIKRKNGLEPVTYPHPVFEPYLRETLGVVAYQEQVMQIGREIGDLSWEDVTDLRKSMSRSLGKEYFDKYGNRWKKGAIKKGVSKNIVDKMLNK